MVTGLRARALLLALLLAAPPAPAQDDGAIRPRIANGLPTTAWPEVAMLFALTPDGDTRGTCTATLVGCRTVLTAAHCLCWEGGRGESCGNGEFADRPEDVVLFFPQAGTFQPESIRIAPGFEFGLAADFALLQLPAPLRGIRPRAINELALPPFGTTGTIVGFGATTESANDSGILRTGLVTTGGCGGLVPNATHVCWTFAAPIGSAGTDSNTCSGDSGGPLLADLGAGLTLAGVHSGGSQQSCDVPPVPSFDADVFVERTWLRSQAGADLDQAACGDGPQVGDPEVTSLGFTGSASSTQQFHDFTIPPGVRRMRVALNGIADPFSELHLYVGLGARPSTASFACASTFAGNFGFCDLADPPAGTGHVLVRREAGPTRAYQVRVTMLPEDPPPPPLAGPGVLVASFSGFELVQIDPAGGRRAVVSSALRGGGPDLAGPEGLALDPDGSVLVANAFDRSLLRVDRASGARTLVSGCTDAACTTTRGLGPPFLGPRFVTRGPDGAWLVADRLVVDLFLPLYANALVRVNPADGVRTVLSGCSDDDCTAVVGGGPAFWRLFGIAAEPTGAVVVADGRAVVRVDLADGNRTIVSGCSDGTCNVGGGPAFGEPVDLVVEPGGTLLVSYRLEGSAFGAIRRVDPGSGDRTLVSGCENTACTRLRGAGPAFSDLFGLAAGPGGELFASDSVLDAVFRVDPASGDRTLVSGCADPSCTVVAGPGPGLGEAVDLLVVPEPGAGLGGLAAGAALAAIGRRGGRGRRHGR